MATSVSKKKVRVCVIGAGAAGLCAAHHLSNDLSSFEPAIFEQSETIGGTWVYNNNTGVDDNGHPIHSSMYKNLRTNLPLIVMNFPDFQSMNQKQPAYGTHTQVLDYLNDYAKHFQLHQYIQFNTKVECIQPEILNENWQKTMWKVRIKHLKTSIVEDEIFDAIMVCNGHYSTPKIPTISGIETFPNDSIIHSHDYRTPEKYSHKVVVILGAGSSGVDIGIQVSNCAQHVYLSHNNSRFTCALPSNMTEVSGIESINGNNFILNDGTIIVADKLIYCTGYHYSFPFLNDSCKIKVNGNHVTPLYKHLINVEHPKMAIVGIPTLTIPFPLFHYQIQFFLALLLNRIDLPSKNIMLKDTEANGKKHPHKFNEMQWEYNDSLAIAAGVDKLPAFYKNGYIENKRVRMANVLQYQNSEIIIEDNGETVHINIQ